MILLTLVQNIALLVTLATVYQILESRLKQDTLQFQVLSGLLFGIVGVLGMMTPLNLLPGVIFDGRSVILSVAGLFGGPIVGLIAAAMCGAYRLWLGGAGAWVGVAVTLESAALGIAFYYYLRRHAGSRPSAWAYLGFGFLVHLIMVAFMLALPGGAGPQVLRQIGPPVLLLFPLATMLVCLLFQDYKSRLGDRRALQQNEGKYRLLAEYATDVIWVLDLQTSCFTYVSPSVEHLRGYTAEEVLSQHMGDAITPASLQYLQTILPQRLQSFEQGKVEFYVDEIEQTCKDGSIILTEVATRYLSNHATGHLDVIGVSRDISARKQAERELQRRADEMTVLREVMLELTSQHDLSILLHLIVESAARLLQAESGGLYLCDPARQEVACVVSYNTPNDYTGTVLKYGEGAAGVVAQTGEALIIDDYRQWPGRAKVFEAEQPFSAVLATPMIWQEQILGVIHALHRETGRRFTPHERDLMTLFANQAAVAVQNTHLIKALRQNEHRLRAVLDSTPFPIALVDNQDNVIDFWSRSALDLFGHTAPTAPEWYQLAYPDPDYQREVIERWKPFIEQARLSGQTINTREYRVTCKDGSVRICELYAAFSSDRLIVTFNDVTARKQAEEALRRQNEYLIALQTTTLELLSQLDLDTLLVNIVTRAGQLMGTNSGYIDLLDPKTGNLVPRSGVGALTESLRHPVKSGEGVTGIVWQTRQPFWINDYDHWCGRISDFAYGEVYSIIGIPLLSGDQILGVLGLGYDYASRQDFKPEAIETLTPFARLAAVAIENARLFSAVQQELGERKRAEANLQETTQTLQAIVQVSPLPIVALARDGTIQMWNRAAENVFGWTEKEVLGGQNPNVPDDGQEESGALFKQVLVGRDFTGIETRRQRKDGSWVDVSISIAPLEDGHGVIRGGMAVYSDITERKKAEQKIADALQEKEILLRELYHRTKNNMQVILSMLSIESAKSRNKEIKTSFKEIANRIQAMALVHEKLYQSQNLSRINAQEYLQDLVGLLLNSYRLRADKIVLRSEIEPVGLLIDTAIPLGLVVTELVSNTLKYAFPDEKDGEITLRLVQTGQQIELDYADNGVGLLPDFDFRAQKSYGLRSIFALVEHQLQGEINFPTDQPGFACQVRFLDIFYAPRVEK